MTYEMTRKILNLAETVKDLKLVALEREVPDSIIVKMDELEEYIRKYAKQEAV